MNVRFFTIGYYILHKVLLNFQVTLYLTERKIEFRYLSWLLTTPAYISMFVTLTHARVFEYIDLHVQRREASRDYNIFFQRKYLVSIQFLVKLN